MLDKIMAKGDEYIPNWMGKNIKSANVHFYRFGGLNPIETDQTETVNQIMALVQINGVMYAKSPSVSNMQLGWFKMTEYLQNGGVLRKLKNAIHQWLGGVSLAY